MTWLIQSDPYWLCHSCERPAIYKPGDNCEEGKHRRYYGKRLKST